MPFVRERVEHAADWSITVERDIQPEGSRTRLIANQTLAIHVCTHVEDDGPHTPRVRRRKTAPSGSGQIGGRHQANVRHHSMVTREPKPRRSAGTRTMTDILKALFRRPTSAQSQGDVEALQLGEGRRVSCFLRASFGPYPRKVRQGTLDLSPPIARWRPFWSLRRRPLTIASRIESVTMRPPGPDEWNVKKGGSALGVPIPQFLTVVCTTTDGTVELTVPDVDAQLVARFFRAQSAGTQ